MYVNTVGIAVMLLMNWQLLLMLFTVKYTNQQQAHTRMNEQESKKVHAVETQVSVSTTWSI